MSDREEKFLAYEEDFHGNDRKLSKTERKIAVRKDRSRHKKSDRDQKEKNRKGESIPEEGTPGRVFGIDPEGVEVDANGVRYRCRIKGSFKKDPSDTKNLIAVGDFVRFDPETLQIIGIEPRYSILSRADNLRQRKEQLIAVNLDRVFITASILSPPLKPALLDRYILAARKGNMEPVIVINKIDLLETPEEKALLEEYKALYEKLGILFLAVSAETGEGMEGLRQAMQGKTSVFSGQSGTGKSSLINLVTKADLPTGPVTVKTEKGSHTTTRARLLPLEGGGCCIDTPGIRSFGVWDVKPEDIAKYFPEIEAAAKLCKFRGCSHTCEPDCAVLQEIENDTISPIRLASYFGLLATTRTPHRSR